LRFLDETVKQNHPAFTGGEDDAGNPIRQARANFPQARVEFSDEWHPERSAELHGLDVFANDPAFCARQRFQPLAHRLVASERGEESDG